MAQSTLWWLLAGAAIGVELVTGTFYLLMLGIALAAGAIAAHLGMGLTGQTVMAAIVGAGTVSALRFYKHSRPASAPASANRDVNLDVGETVQVETWNPDGTSSVKYRGANWAVGSVSGGPLAAGPHQIVEVIGSRLIVRKL